MIIHLFFGTLSANAKSSVKPFPKHASHAITIKSKIYYDESETAKDSARKIIEDCIFTHGGAEQIRKRLSMDVKSYGTVFEGTKKFNTEEFSTAKGYFVKWSNDKVSIIHGFDGKQSWHCKNEMSVLDPLLNSYSARFYFNNGYLDALANYDPKRDIALLPSINFEGIMCPGIAVRAVGGSSDNKDWVALWVDPNSHMIIQLVTCRVSQDGATRILTPTTMNVFSDFAMCGDFMVAKKIVQCSATSKHTFIFSKFEFSEPGSNSEIRSPFAPPRLDKPVTLPVENSNSKLVVSGLINGYPGKVVFDTGASASYMSALFAEASAIEIDKNRGKTSVYSISSRAKFAHACIPTLKLSDELQMKNMSVKLNPYYGVDYAVAPGMDFLQYYSFRIDFKNKIVTLSNSENLTESEQKSFRVVPLILADQVWVKGSFDEEQYSYFVVDTGSPGTLLLNPNNFANLKLSFQDSTDLKSGVIHDLNRASMPVTLVRLKSFKIADTLLKNVEVGVMPKKLKFRNASIIGLRLLNVFSEIRFDFLNSRLLVRVEDKSDFNGSIDCSNKYFGLKK